MGWDAIEKKVTMHYPYPLAKSFTSYFLAKPEGIQNTIWMYKLVSDIIQYVALILVADLYRHKLLVSLMSHYTLRDWIELLERQLREEFLRNSQRHVLSEVIRDIQRQWQDAKMISASQETSWYEQAKNSPYFPPIDWDELVCAEILIHMCTTLTPLLDFPLIWIWPQGKKRSALLLEGISPDKWKKITLNTCQVRLNRLALCHENNYTDLFPFVLAHKMSRAKPKILLWDGDISKEEKVLYHEQNRDWILPFDEIEGYRDIQLARCLPDSSYAGLIRHAGHQVKRFCARQSQGGRYPRLLFSPPYELIAELNNFLAGRFYRAAAILTGAQGVGKTNLVCYLAQQWAREGHLPIIIEARDVTQGTLNSLAAQCYGKNHSWNILLKEIPGDLGKRCVIILVGVEKHPNVENFLEQLREFLQKYENPSYPLCVLLVCDSDFLLEKLTQKQDLFASDLFYHAQSCVFREYPFILEVSSLPSWKLEKTYIQYQKLVGHRTKTPCSQLTPRVQRHLCLPVWLKLLQATAAWEIPTDVKSEEILYNYLDHNLWEHPSISQKFEQVLPLFSKDTEILESTLIEHCEIADSEFFNACRQQEILERRTALNGEKKVGFCLLIIRDFLLAQYFFKKGESELFEQFERVNYKTAAWLFYFNLLQKPGELPSLWEKLSQYPMIVAEALVLVEEIWPISNAQSEHLISLFRELLSKGELGTEVILAFLEKIEKNEEETSRIVFEFLLEEAALTPEQLLQILQIAIRCRFEINPEQWSILLKQETTYLPVCRLLSQIYYMQGDFSQALEYANNVDAAGNQDSQQCYLDWQQLAACYYCLQDYPQARNYYEKILRLAQELNDAKTFIATGYHMAQIHVKNGDMKSAISCYDEILDLNQQLGNVLNQMKALRAKGVLEKQQSRADEAQIHYQHAYEFAGSLLAYPKMVEILIDMGCCYREHDNDKALQYYQYALKLAQIFSPPQLIAKIYHFLADCCDNDQKSKAVSLLNEAANIYRHITKKNKTLEVLAALKSVEKKLLSMKGT